MDQKRSKAFTLVETVTATLILSGTILGFIRIMADNLRVSRETELRMTATLLAEGDMERIKGVLFSDSGFSDIDWSTNVLGGGYLTKSCATTQGTYLKQITVQAGYDTNGNSSLDSGEILVTLNTLYADS